MPVNSTSPSGRAAAGTTSSMRGSGKASAGWVRERGMADLDPDAAKRMRHPKHTARRQHRRRRCPSLRAGLQLTGGKRLGDVEEPEEDQGNQPVTPVGRAAQQGDPLAGDLVDDHESRIMPAAFASGDGGRGNAESDGQRRSRKMKRTQSMRGAGCRRPARHAAHSSTAATEPQVPGPGLPKPAPKKVATVQAHSGLLRGAARRDGIGTLRGALAAISSFASLCCGLRPGRPDLRELRDRAPEN